MRTDLIFRVSKPRRWIVNWSSKFRLLDEGPPKVELACSEAESGLWAVCVAGGGPIAKRPQNSWFEIKDSLICSDRITTFVLYAGFAGSDVNTRNYEDRFNDKPFQLRSQLTATTILRTSCRRYSGNATDPVISSPEYTRGTPWVLPARLFMEITAYSSRLYVSIEYTGSELITACL